MYEFISKIDESREFCKNSKNSVETRISELKSLRNTVSKSIRQLNESKILNVPKKSTPFLIHTIDQPNEKEFALIYNEIMTYASKAILLLSKKIVKENTEFLNELKINSFVAENASEPDNFKDEEPENVKIEKIILPEVKPSKIPIIFEGYDSRQPEEQSMEIFTGQSVPEFFYEKGKTQMGLLGVEGSGESRVFFEDPSGYKKTLDFLEECDGTCEPIHEMIMGVCRFYCDLDDKTGILNRDEFAAKINIMAHYFKDFFAQFYEIQNEIFVNFYIAQSENPNYNSAHIYIDVIDTKRFKYFYAKEPQDQLPFWQQFDAFLNTISYYGDHSLIDYSVYKKNSQLRLPGTRKNGYLLRPYTENSVYLIEGRESNLFNDRRGLSLQINHSYDSRFCAGVFDGYCAELLESKFEKAEPQFKTEFEKLLFERILQRSQLVIPPLGEKDKNNSGKDSIFKTAVYRIYCFYAKLPRESIIKNILNFMKTRDRGNEEETRLVRKLVYAWGMNGKFHNFAMNSNKEFFKYQAAKPIRIETDSLTYGDFEGIVCIKSGTGTGKTYGFIKKNKDKRCLYISCKISLADEFKRTAKNLGVNMVHYQDPEALEILKNYKESGEVPQHFCVQLNSLHNYAEIIEEYDQIFIDESEALFGCFTHLLETNPKAMAGTRAAFFEIMKKNVVFCSANMGERTFMFIEDYGRPFVVIENLKKDKEGYTATECTHKGFFAKLKNFVENDKKVAVSCNSKKMATQIEMFIGSVKPAKKVLKQTSIDKKIDISEWTNYDYLVHTSTIESGVSFVEDHFDYLMGYFKSGINTYDSCYQMLFRVRHPKNKELFLYLTHGRKLKTADRMNNVRAAQQVDFHLRENLHNDAKKNTFNDFVYSKSRDPIDRVLLRNIFVKGYSDTYFKVLLKAELRGAGIKFNLKKYDAQFKSVEGVNEKYNAELLEKSENIKFHFERMKINSENFKIPETVNNTSLETLVGRAYSRYKLLFGEKLNFRETAAEMLTESLKKGKFSDEELDKELCQIFDKNYDAFAACFGKRKYLKSEMLGRKLQYKVQFIKGILNDVGYDIQKEENGYKIFGIECVESILFQSSLFKGI